MFVWGAQVHLPRTVAETIQSHTQNGQHRHNTPGLVWGARVSRQLTVEETTRVWGHSVKNLPPPMCTHADRFIVSYMWHRPFIHMCDMTHSYVWHDGFICVAWLVRMFDTTHFLRAMMHSCGWLDTFTRVTRLVHACPMTYSCIRTTSHVLSTRACSPRCMTWRIHMRDMTHSHLTWQIHMCYMTHLCMRTVSHVLSTCACSPRCVTWIIHIRDMTHAYV